MKSFVFIIALFLCATSYSQESTAPVNINSADILFQPESSVPSFDRPWKALVNKSVVKKIRVKVFPHDLNNDWVHGVPDNPTRVVLEGDQFSVKGRSSNRASIKVQGSNLIVTLSNGVAFSTKRTMFTSASPIKVVRERNLSKSHSYNGALEVFIKNGEVVVVNHVDIEEYLRGVVPKEAVHTWPLEALKAQAVAARSYAYYHLLTSSGRDYDGDDTARYQVYAGVSAAQASTDQAVRQTAHEVLMHDDSVIVAFFHAYSGGRTDSSENIFNQKLEYCQGNDEIFSRNELKNELSARSRWIVEWTTDWYSQSALMSKLKASSHSRSDFRNFTSSRSYKVVEATLQPEFNSVRTMGFSQRGHNASLDFKTLRSVLGWSNFPAYHFRLMTNSQGKIAFKGHGWGHHVGLSQWGAFIMAKNYGKTYDEILYHYYTNVRLQNI